jgi:hypothetical protein
MRLPKHIQQKPNLNPFKESSISPKDLSSITTPKDDISISKQPSKHLNGQNLPQKINIASFYASSKLLSSESNFPIAKAKSSKPRLALVNLETGLEEREVKMVEVIQKIKNDKEKPMFKV